MARTREWWSHEWRGRANSGYRLGAEVHFSRVRASGEATVGAFARTVDDHVEASM